MEREEGKWDAKTVRQGAKMEAWVLLFGVLQEFAQGGVQKSKWPKVKELFDLCHSSVSTPILAFKSEL